MAVKLSLNDETFEPWLMWGMTVMHVNKQVGKGHCTTVGIYNLTA